jgi:hypothetical protein
MFIMKKGGNKKTNDRHKKERRRNRYISLFSFSTWILSIFTLFLKGKRIFTFNVPIKYFMNNEQDVHCHTQEHYREIKGKQKIIFPPARRHHHIFLCVQLFFRERIYLMMEGGPKKFHFSACFSSHHCHHRGRLFTLTNCLLRGDILITFLSIN